MKVTQRAPGGGKSSACQGAAQVIIGVAVAAGKMWAGEPENILDGGGRDSLRQQMPGDPEIDNAPVRLVVIASRFLRLRSSSAAKRPDKGSGTTSGQRAEADPPVNQMS